MRLFTIVVGTIIAAIVIGVALVPEGEVVTLETVQEDGSSLQTQLWLVERRGTVYLQAHSENAEWLGRLRSHPEVELTRGDSRRSYVASLVEDAATRREVHAAIAEKYGVASRLVGIFFDRERVVAVRLDPGLALAPETGGSSHGH